MTTAARWRLRHRQALQAPPSDPPSPADRVAALAWAPSTSGIDGAAAAGGEPPQQQAQLAVAVIGSGGRPAVHMFDGEGRRVDRVPLKPAVKDGSRDFGVTGLAFSPDDDSGGRRLAVAQTDGIVYVYRLGERKSICNKFQVVASLSRAEAKRDASGANGAPVTCLAWSASQPHTIVFGLADGHVLAGDCRSNEATTLYQAESGTTALAVNPDGRSLASTHRDGALWRCAMADDAAPSSSSITNPVLLARHPCVPIAVGHCGVRGEPALLAAGIDGRLCIYGARDGTLLQAVDSGGMCRSMALHGSRVALGELDAIRVFEQRAPGDAWQALGTYTIPGLHLATGVAWRPDRRQLAVASLCGAVDVLELVEEPGPSMATPTAAGTGNDAAAAAATTAAKTSSSGTDDALFQRARALGYEQGIQLLQAQGRLEAAVDAALDAGDFAYALRVCDLSLPRRLPEAHRRHARHLEARGQHAEAEAAFLRARDPQAAIDMHLRLHDHAAARRLAQSHLPAALPGVLAAEASALVGGGQPSARPAELDEEEARLARAEALYLKAGQPEQALQVYLEAKAWAGAFRVAQRHCRWRLGAAVAAYEKGASRRGEDGGKGHGRGRQHHDDALTRAYGQRVDGAQHDRYLGQLLRALEIVGGELREWEAAWAMVRVEAEGGGAWASAKRATDRLVCVQLWDVIATAGEDGDGNDNNDDGVSPLPLLGTALALLQEKGAPCPVAEPLAVDVYKRLVTRLLGMTHEEEATEEGMDAIRAWRRLLLAVLVGQVDPRLRMPPLGAAKAVATTTTATVTAAEERAAHEFRDLFLALHHTHILLACCPHPPLGGVACRAALAALRFAGTLLPPDKAFYRAGMALRQHAESLVASGNDEGSTVEAAAACRHLAFLCLNRYVDLAEAISDQDPSLVDPTPLAGCTALPSPSSIPRRQHVTDEAAREAVRSWVLGACVDMAGREPLRREKEGGGGGLAEVLFATPPAHERCAVTGCPLRGRTTAVGGKPVDAGAVAGGAWQPIGRASAWAWEAYVEVFGECPWTGEAVGKV